MKLNVDAPVRTLLSATLLAVLAACGGGGGDTAGGGGGGGGTTSGVTVQGIAAKGLLKQAIVKAYRIESNGSRTLIKESVTDTDGSYSLADIPAGVTVLVEIAPRP
jgi:hypothetical protein